MSPDLEPVAVQPFEGPQVQQLQWMPLAVRYKLDVLGLHLRLEQWRALSVEQRRLLVQSPVGPVGAKCALRQRLMQAGAVEDVRGCTAFDRFDEYLASRRRCGGGPRDAGGEDPVAGTPAP